MNAARFRALWDTLVDIGRDAGTGGYNRLAWTGAELACRRWFTDQAAGRGLAVHTDPVGNLWASWVPAGVPDDAPAVVAGSHLDSVPQGGAYDGPLGVVSAFAAIDELRERGVRPLRPLRVAAFTDEEGGRFGLACLGSRLLTGALDPVRALALCDSSGTSLAEAMRLAGHDPSVVDAQPAQVAGIGCYLELHVEQGRALDTLDAPLGVCRGIWPHGRWRLDLTGAANHAGTTGMGDRRDPMLTFAYAVLAANKQARLRGAHATIGRVAAWPNATNAVPARITAWLDARAPAAATLEELVAAVGAAVAERAARDGTAASLTAESLSPPVVFHSGLVELLGARLAGRVPGGRVPVLDTAAGHDAGVLAARVPSAMIFVRNPTGVSHAPLEHATDADCALGIDALADALAELATAPQLAGVLDATGATA